MNTLLPISIVVIFLHFFLIFQLHISSKTPVSKQTIRVQNVVLKPKLETKPVTTLKPTQGAKSSKAAERTSKELPSSKKKRAQKPPLNRQAYTKKPRSSSGQKADAIPQQKQNAPSPTNNLPVTWQEKFTQLLHESLHFPEFGKVKISLEILGNGQIKQIQILDSENEKNAEYLLKALMTIQLPKWSMNASDQENLIITFANEMD